MQVLARRSIGHEAHAAPEVAAGEGVELIGDESLYADAEVILLATEILRKLRVESGRIVIGHTQLDLWSRSFHAFWDARPTYDQAQFADVAFTDLRDDPIGTTRGIYEQFGLDWTPDVQTAIEDYFGGLTRRVLVIAFICVAYAAAATGLFAIARLAL